MTRNRAFHRLFETGSKYPNNFKLLQKILWLAGRGLLQINGQYPDQAYSLGSYLFDDKNLIIDVKGLDRLHKEAFYKWFLEPHEAEQSSIYTDVIINEDRGFTAEEQLGLFERILRWIKYKPTPYWPIHHPHLLEMFQFNYCLAGLEILSGQEGYLVSFRQLNPQLQQECKEEGSNSKRIILNNQLVDRLMETDLSQINFPQLCEQSHPLSIEVKDDEERNKKMRDYRIFHVFSKLRVWYQQLWLWLLSWVTQQTKIVIELLLKAEVKKIAYDWQCIDKNEQFAVYLDQCSQKIKIIEQKPDPDIMVFCGGGGKIFAHIGAWKAIRENKLKIKKFAGSSAGAIMALLCYLGYSDEDIKFFFQQFNQNHLVNFQNMSLAGISDISSMKTALDYIIAYKVNEIVSKEKLPFPTGSITFATLARLKQQCPDCGIGDELSVTATELGSGKTIYYSTKLTPEFEVSDVVATSASFPILFKATERGNGKKYTDGAVSDGLPVHAFPNEQKTFLQTESNLHVLAVQFDNDGTERQAVDTRKKVYKENRFLNWFYGLATRVRNPRRFWAKDRNKLRDYAGVTIIPKVEGVSATNFNVTKEDQDRLSASGYDAAQTHFNLRYENKQNVEQMHALFESWEELLNYCCYSQNKEWFERIKEYIAFYATDSDKTVLKAKIKDLEQLYFAPIVSDKSITALDEQLNYYCYKKDETNVRRIIKDIEQLPDQKNKEALLSEAKILQRLCFSPLKKEFALDRQCHTLLILYPILLQLTADFVSTKEDRERLNAAHHAVSIGTPFGCLKFLQNIKGECSILLPIITQLIKQMEAKTLDKVDEALAMVNELLKNKNKFLVKAYKRRWNLDWTQSLSVLTKLYQNQELSAVFLDNLGVKQYH